MTIVERRAAWADALSAVDTATAHLRQMAADSDSSADAAWAASGMLHVTAAVLGSRILREAADAYDRAARAPYARVPAPTPAGDRLRGAARLLSALAFITGDPSVRQVALITRLAMLAEAVARLRESQQRAGQAASALSAARHLHVAAATDRAAQAVSTAGSATRLAGAGFPVAPGHAAAGPTAPGPAPPPARRSPRPRR